MADTTSCSSLIGFYRKQIAEKAKDGSLKVETNGSKASSAPAAGENYQPITVSFNNIDQSAAPKRRGRWDQTADETPAKTAKKPASSFFTSESATPGHNAAWAGE